MVMLPGVSSVLSMNLIFLCHEKLRKDIPKIMYYCFKLFPSHSVLSVGQVILAPHSCTALHV